MDNYEAIIVGAGVAGCPMAYVLGDSGRKVLLLERDLSEPDRIVGELLQPGGINALRQMGLQDCVENIDGQPIYGYGLIRGDQRVDIAYPVTKHGKKPEGKGFHHGRFIMNLRKACFGQKNVTVTEGTVLELISDEEKVVGCRYREKQNGMSVEKEVFAPLTIVADGCFSKFRKHYIKKDVEVTSHFAGIILKTTALPFPNRGNVIAAHPSPMVVYPISSNESRILIDIPGKVPSAGSGELKRYLENEVGPQLPKSLQSAFFEAVETSRCRVMPNSLLPPSMNQTKGLIVIGDAMNMRHPLTGGGMTVAFWDVAFLSELLSPSIIPSFRDTEKTLKQSQKLHWKRKQISSAINILAKALYSLMATGNDPARELLLDALTEYLALGSIFSNHPAGLVSGLINQPLILFFHFFAVAFYACYVCFRDVKSLSELPSKILLCGHILWIAVSVITPLILNEVRY